MRALCMGIVLAAAALAGAAETEVNETSSSTSSEFSVGNPLPEVPRIECGWLRDDGNSTPTHLWNIVVPDYLDRELEGGMIGLQAYDERQPRALLNHLNAQNRSLACSENFGVAFARGGSSWTRLSGCLEEHETLDYTVVNTDLTVADCKKLCTRVPGEDYDAYAFCSVIEPGLPLSAPIPQFLLMKTGRPAQLFYEHVASDGQKAATFGARGAVVVPGRERVCSVEAVSAALFLGNNKQLHVCSVQEALGDRFVQFASGAAQLSDTSSDERIDILGVVVVGGGLAAAVLAGLNTLARDYPATVSLTVNTLSSVAIIFINKVIYQRGFDYVVTLGGIHFLATSSIRFCAKKQTAKEGDISVRDVVIFTLLNTGALSFSNLSLYFNSVGFYQIAKLMLMPTTCVMEFFVFGNRPSAPILASVALVVVGVGIATVSGVSMNMTGFVIALLQVFFAGSMQIHVFFLQQKYNMRAETFVAQTAFIQGATLLTMGPILDRAITGSWVFDLFLNEDPTVPGTAFYVAVSAAVAIAVNVSQAAAIGAASALAFQVLGHAKTILVLIIAYLFFDSHWTARSLSGAALALLGIVSYGVYRNREQARKAAQPLQDKIDKEEGGVGNAKGAGAGMLGAGAGAGRGAGEHDGGGHGENPLLPRSGPAGGDEEEALLSPSGGSASSGRRPLHPM